MAVRIADSLKQQNDLTTFPVAYGSDIWIDKKKGEGDPEYKGIQEMYNDGELGGGGSGDVITEWSDTPSDEKVASEKLVKTLTQNPNTSAGIEKSGLYFADGINTPSLNYGDSSTYKEISLTDTITIKATNADEESNEIGKYINVSDNAILLADAVNETGIIVENTNIELKATDADSIYSQVDIGAGAISVLGTKFSGTFNDETLELQHTNDNSDTTRMSFDTDNNIYIQSSSTTEGDKFANKLRVAKDGVYLNADIDNGTDNFIEHIGISTSGFDLSHYVTHEDKTTTVAQINTSEDGKIECQSVNIDLNYEGFKLKKSDETEGDSSVKIDTANIVVTNTTIDPETSEKTTNEYTLEYPSKSGTLATLADCGAGNSIAITWSELKTLRDEKKLIPGTVYRITDYVCTTTQENTRAKNNLFDILVTAISKEELNENASATYHEGDTYFANESLPIWDLKYCLDNDTTRFAWADADNGKGVIWYMKDEYDNECAYDFKNIQFLRDEAFNTKYSVDVPHYYLTAADYYYYTFTVINESNLYDMSCMSTVKAAGITWTCTGNKLLGLSLSTANNIRELTCNIICGNVTGTNNEHSVCYNTITGNKNTFGGRNINNNYLSVDAYNNFFADEGYCYGNEFEHAYDNVFKGPCFSNRVAYTGFNGNVFYKKCASNTFNGWVEKNTFKNIFSYNIIGGTSSNNIINQESYRNYYGHNFIGNVIDCYTEDNTFGNNIRYVHFNGDATTKVYNYYIASGLQGTSTTKLEVTPVANRTNEYTISRKTDGTIVDYCTADVALEYATDDDIDGLFN